MDTLAELVGNVIVFIGGLIVVALISLIPDFLISWYAVTAANDSFHTHLGTFDILWLVVAAGVFIQWNVKTAPSKD